MLIIGCDYHPSFQQIAFVDTETGELREERSDHREGAEKFYRGLAMAGQQVRVTVAGRRDAWVGLSPDLKRLGSEPRIAKQNRQRE